MKTYLPFKAILVCVFLLLSACGFQHGPVLKQSSLGFNKALQHALSEQMLLNLVRLRYGEPPIFLEVTSISSQYAFSSDFSGGVKINEVFPDSYSLNLGFSYATKPTFTFVPLQGEEFAKRLLSPIPIEHLILLLNSGWRVDRVLRLCVQAINDLPNAPTASGPTPAEAPEFKDFLVLSRKLEILRKKGLIKFLLLQKDHQTLPVLMLDSRAEDLPVTDEIRHILKLEKASYYPLVGPETPPGPRHIRIETRSLIGVLFYLSQGLEVPQEDLQSGRVTLTRYPDGRPFSWQEMLGDLFYVRTSEKLPSQAALAVKYRGRWFYILDTDLPTKSTFILLQQLFALEASKGKILSPLLTLPVGQ
ncbi:MAG TPA: hypothetical protein EYP81_04320 [Thermodesulfobacteriaceae bacterium]|nr:hypothetical protein [Thermodesulfobacteriaceae bacterium]